ncbi:MAG: toll/interleukin-1 receptor domain-containing protein [Saprospirales bacterium]|jgi:internalin A|nr:toll/interleukin-1 receptor domain-containing protein [Saprospirales bacterium]MBK8922491.1 toll/interleukin-1 receptor domain-containing protein [Saprospirales bacterium]
MPSTPEIFISYAWGESREDIVEKLYNILLAKGYAVQRDKVNIGYKGNIKQFMQQLGAGGAIVVVLSKKYLESPYCMYEALQIRENGDFERRIFPIVLADANIFDPLVQLDYVSFWDQKINELQEKMRQATSLTHIKPIQEALDLYADIRRFIASFMDVIKNMNVLTPKMHLESDFSALLKNLDAIFPNQP